MVMRLVLITLLTLTGSLSLLNSAGRWLTCPALAVDNEPFVWNPQANVSRRARGRALIVGIEKYQDPTVKRTLGGVADADAISRLIREQGWFGTEEIRILTNEMATAERIESEFKNWLIKETRPGDRVMFFYAGHGTRVRDVDGDERATDPRDRHDEAIAPYNVLRDQAGLRHIITDDQFNQWIAELKGRSIVMIFDSCHSGTVTRAIGGRPGPVDSSAERYLPAPDDHEESEQRRSTIDQVETGEKGDPAMNQSRNLTLPIDKPRTPRNSLVTIISAARSYQAAYSMKTSEGTDRGALTYYLEQVLRDSPTRSLTVAELKEKVGESIERAQLEGRLKGRQIPHFEMSAQRLLAARPLFPTVQTDKLALLVSNLINTESRITLTAEVGQFRGSRFVTDSQIFCIGQKIGYQVKSDTPGYVYIIVFSQDDQATIVYPDGQGWRGRESGQVGTEVEMIEGFPVIEPAGRDVAVVLLTRNELTLQNWVNRKMKWDEMFDLLRGEGLLGSEKLKAKVQARGVGRRDQSLPKPVDWQATLITSEARRCRSE